MDGCALEDGDEDTADSKTDDKEVAPEEEAAELDDGKDAVHEEDA